MGANGSFRRDFSLWSTSSAGLLACLSSSELLPVTFGYRWGVYEVDARNLAPHFKTALRHRSLLGRTHMTRTRHLLLQSLTIVVLAGTSNAWAGKDVSARPGEVLPGDVAARVIARIAEARAHQLPGDALENRALKFAAKGVDPKNIERSINEQAQRMENAKAALASGRGSMPAGDEIEAGAEAMRKGVDGAAVSALAKNAPRDRSLAVPLFVIGSLTDRGVSADQAMQSVLDRLTARASDADLESLGSEISPRNNSGQGRPDGQSGREFGQSHRPANSGRPANAGPPAGVPGNGGKKANGQGHKPPPKN